MQCNNVNAYVNGMCQLVKILRSKNNKIRNNKETANWDVHYHFLILRTKNGFRFCIKNLISKATKTLHLESVNKWWFLVSIEDKETIFHLRLKFNRLMLSLRRCISDTSKQTHTHTHTYIYRHTHTHTHTLSLTHTWRKNENKGSEWIAE